MTIAQNIALVQQQIDAACARARRDPAEITLLAVSKQHSVEAVLQAAAAGLQHFGENRVEEAEYKIPAVSAHADKSLTWHMVGHIQSRKAKQIPHLFSVVHSLDRLKLAHKLSELTAEAGIALEVLLEINISGETAKSGFAAAGWEDDAAVKKVLWDAVAEILALPGLKVRGLMTMAPIVEDMEATRPIFAGLRALRAALSDSFQVALPELSMGMTDDYPVAIEEGASIIRVGRAIFGPRNE